MKPFLRSRSTALAAGLVALTAAVTGCASASSTARPSSPPATATAVSTSSSAGTPRQQAEANAALALHPADDDVVTGTGWWLVPGDPQHLLAWEAARLRSRYPLTGWGTTGPRIYSDDFTVSAVPGRPATPSQPGPRSRC